MGHIQFSESGGQMLDNIHTFHATLNHIFIRNCADHHLCAPLPELFGFEPFLVIKGNNLMSLIQKTPDKCFACKTGAPGY